MKLSKLILNKKQKFHLMNLRRTIKYEYAPFKTWKTQSTIKLKTENEYEYVLCGNLYHFTHTFLNISRQHETLPKQPRDTGFCAAILTISKIRCTFAGNRYQWNWSIESSISMNALAVRSPSSHVMKTTTNVLNPLNPTANISDELFPWWFD